MPFTLRLYQRFPVYCSVTYHAGGIGSMRQETRCWKGKNRSAKGEEKVLG